MKISRLFVLAVFGLGFLLPQSGKGTNEPQCLTLWTLALVDAVCYDLPKFEALANDPMFSVSDVQLIDHGDSYEFEIGGFVYREGEFPSVSMSSSRKMVRILANPQIHWNPRAKRETGVGRAGKTFLNALLNMPAIQRKKIFTRDNRVVHLAYIHGKLEVTMANSGWIPSPSVRILMEPPCFYGGPCTGPKVYQVSVSVVRH